MLNRRQVFQFAGVATVAGASGAAWMYFGSTRSQALVAGPFRHYPFDPVAAENFRQKLFIPVASGPFGVFDVAGPLKKIDFAHDFPGDQTYVFHCHNLEHEDAGMMINFRVRA